jgi:predicted phage terminase large subunit-like protein
MPPRHGKSEFTSKYFPAWYLGTFSDRRVILTSYEADFAASWGRKVRDILDEAGPEYFGVSVRPDSSAADRWDVVGHDGGMNTAGVGGPITGKGAHLLLIDDPVKNAEEANSPTYREKAWEWFKSTAYTRLEPGAAIILIQTRWHEDDLAGKVLSHAKATGEAWDVLNLSAVAGKDDPLGRAPGAALWPARYDEVALAKIKLAIGSYWFAALYDGSPQPAEGNKFKRPWFRYWKADGDLYRLMDASGSVVRSVRARDCRRFGTADLAVSLRTSADYTVLGAWAVTPESDLILLDLIRARLEEPDIIRQALGLYRRHDLAYLAVEANGVQLGIVQTMRRGTLDDTGLARGDGMAIRGITNSTDKVSRASTAIVRCEAGQVYFPWGAAWLGDYETELLGFPMATHDDQVDMTSLAANDVFTFGGAPEPEEAREAREEAERTKADAEWHSETNEAWWGGSGGW